MNQVKWGEYKLGVLFDHIEQGRRLKKDDQIPGDIPFVMSGATNQGVVGFVSNPVAFFPKNSLTVDIFGNAFYRSYAFGAGDDTGVYWNERQHYSPSTMLFFVAAINKALKGQYSYGHKLRSSQSYDFAILLPQTESGEIDFAFMESYVRELEESRLRELETYLIASGLNDYIITSDDRTALDGFRTLQWRKFRVGDLFERIDTKKLPYKAKELPQSPSGANTLPCLTSSFMNQGLNYYVPQEGATVLRNVISVPSNSDVYRAYYQSNDFTVLSDAYAIRWKDASTALQSKQYLFLVACINKVTDLPIYSYKNKLGGWNVVKNKYISLPVTAEDKPDLVFMEQIVTAMQKGVIAEVARFTSDNLAATRQVVDNNQAKNAVRQSFIHKNYQPGFIPLYSLRAACGRFKEHETPEVEGWVDASNRGFVPDKEKHFVVYAKGNSMMPKIEDGELCVFEWYNGGTREGEIVLTQSSTFDPDYDGKYTIKRYESEKRVTEEGWRHSKILLRPLNTEYTTIELDAEDASQYRTIGIFKAVIGRIK